MSPRERYALAAIIAAFLIGGGIILTVPRQLPEDETATTVPEEPELEGAVRIGVVVSSEEEMPAYELLVPLAQGDINEYCMDEGLNCSFEFEIVSGEGTAMIAYQRTQEFKEDGIDLVMGYGWSSHICSTISYVMFNGMVQLSPASTSSICAEEDSTFRLCPHDSKQSVPLARLIRSWSVSDVVILQRKDSWGDGVSEWFRERFEEEGGRIAATITYPAEITGESFPPILEEVNASLSNTFEERDPGNVALLLLSFEEASQILNMSRDYQAMAEVSWFGSEESVTTQLIMEEAGSEAAAVGLFSPFPAVTRDELYERVDAAFETGLGYELGFYDANIYDCCWILALSAIEAGTDDGDVVRTVLPGVASNYSGISGPCTLDAYGDRAAVDYDIWGYIEEEGSCNSVKFGRYDCESDQVELYRSPLHPLEDIVEGEGTAYIGAVSCSDDDYPKFEYLVGAAERDINAHCDLTGAPVRFRFLPHSAGGYTSEALRATQIYHKSGVDLVVGSLWSGQLYGCRCYALDNGMVLMSSLSTAPNLAIDDGIFRLAPHDLKIAYPISESMEDLGVEEVVILQRETSSMDDVAEEFTKYYGGTVAATIRYPAECWGEDFRECLDQAEEALNEAVEEKGADGVALLYLGFSEVRHALGLSSDYPTLSNVTWFGYSGTANLDTVLEEAGEEASRVKLISPQATFSGNPTYDRVSAEYEERFGEPLDLYGANLYDECWIMALSVLESNSTGGLRVQEALPGVASGYKGASGLCLLDENGDRLSVDYGFWGYFEVDGTYKCLRCGTYSYESDEVEWDEALIPPSGEGRG